MLELGWIYEANAPALLRFMAGELWHDVSDQEWHNFFLALDASNAQSGAWVELPLGPLLNISVARDEPGSGRMLIRAEGDNGWVTYLRGLMLFLRRHLVTGEA